MRAAIYARYSSNLQSETSIDDQARQCRKRIDREGWSATTVYSDQAISGASTLRPGYQKMLEDARNGVFDILIAEALDRLSRDLEDIAALYKQLTFAGVKLVTLSEGEINELHVGLKGTMNALFLKDLALKTHRGLEGRIRQGKSGGGKAYGYDVVREFNENGEPIRGGRRINQAQAAIIRRIFEEFTAGHSPRAIAKTLNADGIPGPRNRPWRDTTIRGHHTRRTGILRNDLYVGKLIWNKQKYIKDPKTGKRLARPNQVSDWINKEVPDLRILEQYLWDKVQDRLNGIRMSETVIKARQSRFWEKRRARHLLTGLLTCGNCGGNIASVGKDYLACGVARGSGTCESRRGIKRDLIEQAVLETLKQNLMQPDLVEVFIREFHIEVNKHHRDLEQGLDIKRRELNTLIRKLDGLYEAIADGLRTPGLKAKLEVLESRKTELESEIAAAPPPTPRLHPNLAELYRDKVGKLHQSLNDPETRTEAAEILRTLIEKIKVQPLDDGFEIELIGEIANMVNLASTASHGKKTNNKSAIVPDAYRSSVKVVAGVGFEPTTFRL